MQRRDHDVESSLNCLEPVQLTELLDFVLPDRTLGQMPESPDNTAPDDGNLIRH